MSPVPIVVILMIQIFNCLRVLFALFRMKDGVAERARNHRHSLERIVCDARIITGVVGLFLSIAKNHLLPFIKRRYCNIPRLIHRVDLVYTAK